jgi:hypothetical protein
VTASSTITPRHVAAVLGSAALVFGLAFLGVFSALRPHALPQTDVLGAVLSNDADAQRQMPIANVVIQATIGSYVANAKSDNSGFFRLTVPTLQRLGRTITVHFSHPGYFDYTGLVRDPGDLLIAHLTPLPEPHTAQHPNAAQPIASIRIRYTVKTESFVDVGTIVQTFEARNTGNTPCRNRPPCSPDGAWKAGSGGTTIDAHEGNHFRNTRVSCIAGPCPFTRVEEEGLRDDGRVFVAKAISWSDTATFVVEADIAHSQSSDLSRQTYPVIFGRGMSFTLPPEAEGPSIEAEVNRQDIVFPLGPDLILSWADCSVKPDADRSNSFACELKPGYRFE